MPSAGATDVPLNTKIWLEQDALRDAGVTVDAQDMALVDDTGLEASFTFTEIVWTGGALTVVHSDAPLAFDTACRLILGGDTDQRRPPPPEARAQHTVPGRLPAPC